MLRAISVLCKQSSNGGQTPTPSATVVLAHDERHLRRKAIRLADGASVLVDLPEPVMLSAGDVLILEDGGRLAIAAAEEELCEVTAPDFARLAELAWHIGNRHLPAEISSDRILIQRDHVIEAMLSGLGAQVREVIEAFHPVRGAYAASGGHGHATGHHHGADATTEGRHEHP